MTKVEQGKMEYKKLDDLALLDVLVEHVMRIGGAEPGLIDPKLWTELARRTGRCEEDGRFYIDDNYDWLD